MLTRGSGGERPALWLWLLCTGRAGGCDSCTLGRCPDWSSFRSSSLWSTARCQHCQASSTKTPTSWVLGPRQVCVCIMHSGPSSSALSSKERGKPGIRNAGWGE